MEISAPSKAAQISAPSPASAEICSLDGSEVTERQYCWRVCSPQLPLTMPYTRSQHGAVGGVAGLCAESPRLRGYRGLRTPIGTQRSNGVQLGGDPQGAEEGAAVEQQGEDAARRDLRQRMRSLEKGHDDCPRRLSI